MQLWMVARQATVLKNAPDSGRGRLLTRTPTITPPTTQPRQVLDRGNNREKHLEKAARDAKLRGRRAVGEEQQDMCRRVDGQMRSCLGAIVENII